MQAPGVQIRFAGDSAGFARGFARLHEALDRERLHSVPRYNVELVFEEIVSNIIHYGAEDGHTLDVCVVLDARTDEIVLTFDDNGIAFDSAACTVPPVASSLEEAKIGGFGLFLVRRAVSSLDYCRTAEGRNRLTVAVRRTPAAL